MIPHAKWGGSPGGSHATRDSVINEAISLLAWCVYVNAFRLCAFIIIIIIISRPCGGAVRS